MGVREREKKKKNIKNRENGIKGVLEGRNNGVAGFTNGDRC